MRKLFYGGIVILLLLACSNAPDDLYSFKKGEGIGKFKLGTKISDYKSDLLHNQKKENSMHYESLISGFFRSSSPYSITKCISMQYFMGFKVTQVDLFSNSEGYIEDVDIYLSDTLNSYAAIIHKMDSLFGKKRFSVTEVGTLRTNNYVSNFEVELSTYCAEKSVIEVRYIKDVDFEIKNKNFSIRMSKKDCSYLHGAKTDLFDFTIECPFPLIEKIDKNKCIYHAETMSDSTRYIIHIDNPTPIQSLDELAIITDRAVKDKNLFLYFNFRDNIRCHLAANNNRKLVYEGINSTTGISVYGEDIYMPNNQHNEYICIRMQVLTTLGDISETPEFVNAFFKSFIIRENLSKQ